jgi:hypothetical protein
MSDGPDWVDQARAALAGLGATLGDTLREAAARSAAEPGVHAADCRWCPVCQAAAVLRGERPEVTAALADLVGAAATALRAFAEAGPPAPTAPPDPDPEADVREPADPAPPVQRIEIA